MSRPTSRLPLAISHPEIAAQWDSEINGDLTDDIHAGMITKVSWRCELGHSFENAIRRKVDLNVKCAVCSNRKILAGYNDLATSHPEIAAEWDYNKNGITQPNSVSQGESHYVRWWICPLGHSWDAIIRNRTKGLTAGCTICSGRKLLIGFNDLATLYPHLLEEWDYVLNTGVNPSEVMYNSCQKVYWKCNKNHYWQREISSRTRKRKNDCPDCGNNRPHLGVDDVATLHPELLAFWKTTNKHQPQYVKVNANFQIDLLCNKGHEWSRLIYQYIKTPQCPECNLTVVIPGKNDISTLKPEIAEQWNFYKNAEDIKTISVSSNKKVHWICESQHQWLAVVADRTRIDGKATHCPDCSKSKMYSQAERELSSLLKKFDLNMIVNDKSILPNRKELDIYFPDHNFAIEFNGLYWHDENHVNKNYHEEKRRLCQEKGITLYQVWADDWKLRQNIVIRGILYRLGLLTSYKNVFPSAPPQWSEKVYARKTKVAIIDYSTAKDFLEIHHIQGIAVGTKYVSLKYQGKICAVIVIKKTSKSGIWTIERYATSGVVTGGFTKLLTWCENNVNVIQWITFADRMISEGNLYEKNEFIIDAILMPDYSYVVNKTRIHKFNYRLKRFKEDKKLQYIEGKSERELALLNKIPRIWDAGKIRYVKNVTLKL